MSCCFNYIKYMFNNKKKFKKLNNIKENNNLLNNNTNKTLTEELVNTDKIIKEDHTYWYNYPLYDDNEVNNDYIY